MATHLETLAQYLPAMLIRRSNESHLPIDEPETAKFPAAVMRVDITGFSKLSEGLTTDEATAKLIGLLNGYYSKILSIIFEHQGDVVKFDHSSVVAMWLPQHEERGDVATTILRAGKCALHLTRVITPQEPVPSVRVAIRVGLGVGQVQMMTVGGVENRWEPVLMGSPLEQAEECVHDAEEGDVLITREAWGLIRFRSVGDRAGDNTASLEGIKGTLPPIDLPYPVPNSRSQAPMWSYTPGPIRRHIATGSDDPPADRRPITVLMAHISGVDPQAELETAQEAMMGLQQALYGEEGSVVQVSYERGGLALCAAFGLPPYEHDDDAIRGARAAMAMSRELDRLGLEHNIGVASGEACCAAIGHPKRRTYTIIGKVRNVAAALMRVGDGVLCDTSTRMASNDEIDFEVRAPIEVYGRETPVHRPIDTGVTNKRLPLVGRDQEAQLLAGALDALVAGTTRAVAITGASGIGKTRMLDEVEQLSVSHNLFPLRGMGDSVDSAKPYHAWTEILSKALGFNNPDWSEIEANDVIQRIAESERALELAPLLGEILPVDFEPNAQTVDLVGNSRASAMVELVLEVMRLYTRGRPTLLVIDDVQWLDAESWGLVEAVWRDVQPLLLVVAAREGTESTPLTAILNSPSTSVIPLRPMSNEAIVQMARERFGRLPDVVVDLLSSKAQGHPLYAEQVVALLIQVGDLEQQDDRLVQRAQLDPSVIPNDPRSVIDIRLSLLEERTRKLISVASAVGRTFDFLTLHDVLGESIDMENLAEDLATLQKLDLTPVFRLEPDETFMFKHVLVQEAAYAAMSEADRRDTHRSIAVWYEEEHQDHLDSGAHPRLAMHWRFAGEPSKAAHYVGQAADHAMRNGAWEEARRMLAEALDDKSHKLAEHERARWQRQAGEASLRMGDLAGARDFVNAALATLGVDAPEGGFAARRSMWWQSVVQASHRIYVSKAKDGEDRNEAIEATRSDLLLGEIAQRSNDMVTAKLHTARAVNSGERIGPSPELARAYGQMAAVNQSEGKHGDAEHYADKAIEIANRTKDQEELAQLFRQLGAYFVMTADWPKAVGALEKALIIGDRTGDRQLAAEARAINASSLHYRGEFTAAMKDFALVTREAAAIGHWQLQLDGLCGSAESMMRRGHLTEAAMFLQKAHGLVDERVPPAMLGRITALEAAIYLRRNDFYTAIPKADEAAKILSESRPLTTEYLEAYCALGECYLRGLEDDTAAAEDELDRRDRNSDAAIAWMDEYAAVVPVGRPRALMLKGWAQWLEEEEDKAIRTLREAIELAEEQQQPLDQGLAMLELGRRLGFLQREGREALDEAQNLFTELEAKYDRERAARILDES